MKQGWEIKKLGEVATILNGYAFDSKLFSEDSNDMPLIRIRDIKRGYTETFYKGDFSDEYIIKKGDYLIGMDGEFNIAEWKGNDALLNQRVCKIVANDIVDRYLFWYMPVVLKQIEDATPFVTVKHLSSKQLINTNIPVPPREEQERIVAELDCLSGVIEKKREQLKELDALAQSIFYQMFGDPITNEKGWEVKKLGEVCTINPQKKEATTIVDITDEVSFLPMEDLSIKACYIQPKQSRTFSEVQASYTYFKDGDVLLAKVSPCFENGKIGIAQNLINGIGFGSSEYIVFRLDTSVLKEYLYFFLQDATFVEEATKNLTGTSGLRRVPKSFVENRIIGIPPLTLQQEFADKIEAIEKQKELIKESIKETETLFNARMDYYFN